MTFKTAPLTPIPSTIQRQDPQLYEYLRRLEEVVLGLTNGVNVAQTSAFSSSAAIASMILTLAGKIDKVSSATAGDIAIFLEGGGVVDSGIHSATSPAPGVVPIADENGKLNDWVDNSGGTISTEDFFSIDENGDYEPTENPGLSYSWELDAHLDIQPRTENLWETDINADLEPTE